MPQLPGPGARSPADRGSHHSRLAPGPGARAGDPPALGHGGGKLASPALDAPQAIPDHLDGRLPEAELQATADDAVRLAVEAQLRAGVDVVTDGEQRRDNYASFVGSRLDNCQLIPLTDLLPLVDHREEFEKEMRSLDVPASEVRHPALFGRLGRSRALAVQELEFVQTLTDKPVKVALPGVFGPERVLLTPDRGFATFADNSITSARVAEEKLRAIVHAAEILRRS